MSTNQIDEFSQSFVRLALEINKHIEGYVDSYYGPDFIKREVESTSAITPIQLQENYKHLEEMLPTDDPNRHQYLAALSNAMRCTIEKLNGKEFEYLEEVERLFGVSPRLVDEGEFLEAQKSLGENIPGTGSLPERIRRRKEELTIRPDDIPRAVDMVLEEIRNRSGEIFNYDSGESVEIEYVRDKPWNMDAHYLGNFHTTIRINLDIDRGPLGLTAGLIHEAYPGHHTEFQTKERCLYEEKGYLEESCLLLLTPRAIITEGIAETALEIISPGMQIYEWIAEILIPELALPRISPIELKSMGRAWWLSVNSRSNAAILFHSGKMGKDEAINYIETYALMDRNAAEQFFRMVLDPLYRTYIFTYSEGKPLINQAAKGEDKLPLFRRLLTEQFLPDDLSSAT